MSESLFKDWKCRCSSLGHILTNRPEFTKEQKKELEALEEEKKTGFNANGNKTKWTSTKENKRTALINKRDAPDSLSPGIITHLDNVFRSVFWKRRRLLHNKFLDKGNLAEEDSLELKSQLDGFFYIKNDEQLENDYINGCPDNKQIKIRDTKTNYDLESFDNAELTSLYKWQIKGYTWLALKELKNWSGELDYCLVNNPIHQLQNEITSLYYKMGTPDDDEPRWIEAKQQIERNMIFDIKKWKETYPHYQFDNTILDFEIPAIYRVKTFEVKLSTKDIKFIKHRVKLCRKYLMKKEKEVTQSLTR